MDLFEAVRNYTDRKTFRNALCLPETGILPLSPLAQGECNVNFLFSDPDGRQKYVFRVNLVSQMHLSDQIGYEYRALKSLLPSGRTPRPLYVDEAGLLPSDPGKYGVLVYEYLSGRPLDYRRDLKRAAEIFADIHSVSAGTSGGELITPADPLSAILDECEEMVQTYYQAPIAEEAVKIQIARMLEKGRNILASMPEYNGYRCIVNTEVNSGNFLMNDGGQDYLIDWEKPVYGDPMQDLGHFLAPTTTFWKTDVILTAKEKEAFFASYLDAVRGQFDTLGAKERLNIYIPITCLRGITWCAMAWVQYQDEASGAPKNADTWKKLCAYLKPAFLDAIEKEYLDRKQEMV
ncbi:MAG: aminoglycoside phosphotransferase family protein [Eubacteriales bacterium]|nr:aminoglycoside phosphotransferase family protein [Eubacteriales bacterium]